MQERPPCPPPPGAPRWVAMFHRPGRDSWTLGAESPDRAPVLYAVGDMTRTVRARGEEVAVALWGPGGGAWHLFDTPAAKPATTGAKGPVPEASAQSPASGGGGPSGLAERMTGRRHQVLLAGLGKAGLYELDAEDGEAVRAMAELLDEPTVRRVAHWLSVAGGERGGEPS